MCDPITIVFINIALADIGFRIPKYAKHMTNCNHCKNNFTIQSYDIFCAFLN